MQTITENIALYLSAWNKKKAMEISASLQNCCAAEVTYTDKKAPLLSGIGPLTELIMNLHQMVPGRTFRISTEPEYFDGHCYYSWAMTIPGKEEVIGRDYMEYDAEGRIIKIVGFLP